MRTAPIPPNEKERLVALYKLKILDTPPEERFDRITRLATQLFSVPISTITLVDSNREWFKSCQGLPKREGERAISFCGHAMLADGVFIVPDAAKDERFSDNPMVIGEPHIRFYAGVSISGPDGHRVGTFCIKDHKPRVMTDREIRQLKDLAAWVELELSMHELSDAIVARKKAEKELEKEKRKSIPPQSAFRFFIILILSIFIFEFVIMLVLPLFNLGKTADVLIDPLLLSIILVPLFYFFFFSPIRKYINQIKLIQNELNIEKEALSKENSKNEALLESIGDGVVATDEEGKIITINKQTENLLRLKKGEVLGKKYFTLWEIENYRGERIPTRDRPIQIALDQHKYVRTSQYHYVRPDGTKFPVSITATPIILNNKNIGAIGIFRDITREKEIDRMKDEFLSIASHELRTPLTAIDGITAMIREGEYGKVSENLKQPLNDINISSERLIHLVNDLLSLSRIQAGRMIYSLSEFSMDKIVGEVVQLMQPLSGQKKLQITVKKIEPVAVQADASKIKEVLNNLIGNAIKFTDKGGITISAKIDGERLNIYIEDTGVGIGKEDQKKLFGLFQQLESGMGRPAGTGLGLHISKEIVDRMGGKLWIEKSEEGRGSTFVFSLPIAKSQVAQKAKKELEKDINVGLTKAGS